MIVFVGDKASSKNVSQDVAFVGTPSYKRLLAWIADMRLDLNEILLANREHFNKKLLWKEE